MNLLANRSQLVKQFIKSNPSLVCVILALATLAVDFAAGREIRFPLFYVLPIGLAAWMDRKWLAYVMAITLPAVGVVFEFLWQSTDYLHAEGTNTIIEIGAMILYVFLMGKQGNRSRKMEVTLSTREDEMQHFRAFTRLVGTSLQGRGVSSGLADGVAVVHHPGNDVALGDSNITPDQAAAEVERFDQAVEASIQDLEKIRARFESQKANDECGLIDVQLSLLRDPSFTKKCKARVTDALVSAEHAVGLEIRVMETRLLTLKQEFMRQRSADVRDIGHQVLENLGKSGGAVTAHPLASLPPGAIVVTDDLLLSDALQMDPVNVVAIITERTGPASHVAILARGRRIPAICDINDVVFLVTTGDHLLVDADKGTVTVAPTQSQSAAHFADKEKSAPVSATSVKTPIQSGCKTKDGVEIRLLGNIGQADEARMVMEHGLGGIGLFRSEFLFLDADEPPDSDAQAAAYSEVAGLFDPLPVVIRTMDLGGDQIPRFISAANDPSLRAGMRGLEYSLTESSLFRAQILAILRASQRGNVKIMFPMVMGAADMTAARNVVEEILQGESPGIRPLIGAMIETPSAVFDLRGILAIADFVCIGTNDLSHSILAMDRASQGHSAVRSFLHPSVLKATHQIIRAAKKQAVPLSVCGEAAGDPTVACLLAGMGVRELSMNPFLVENVLHALREVTLEEARQIARKVLAASTPDEVRDTLASSLAPVDSRAS